MVPKKTEYKGRQLIARQYGNGWQIEIRSLAGGQMQTMTYRELSDAIDEAKKIVDASRQISN